MCQNRPIIGVLLGHFVGAVLAHADAVTVAVNRKKPAAVGFFVCELAGTKPQLITELGGLNRFSAVK